MEEAIGIFGLGVVCFIILLFIWAVFIEPLINSLYCLISYEARIKRWEGYYGFLYFNKPLITKTAALMIKYCKENGIDLIESQRQGVLNIPAEYLRPKPEELKVKLWKLNE